MEGNHLNRLKGRLKLGGLLSPRCCSFRNRFSLGVHWWFKLALVGGLFALVLTANAEKERYEFTDKIGRKMEAMIHGYSTEVVAVERVSDGRLFSLVLDTLCDDDQRYLEEHYGNHDSRKQPISGQSLVPGKKILLDFPELGSMAGGMSAQCELSVPKNYGPVRPVPLLVWFSGGKGSYKTDGAKGLVDFDQFLVLALPYPDGSLPRLAVNAGEDEINAFWDFQRPMLERVIEMVPNISEDVRIVGGASSGGHLVGSALDQKWRGFCDYFTGFIMHEGGHSPEMEFSGARSSHHILVIYGEKSTAREWQDFFMERFDQARGRIKYIEVPNAGHGLNGDGRKLIRAWVEETFEKELL